MPDNPPVKTILTSADVFGVLCREISNTSEGRIDPVRANTLCRLVDSTCKLARLQMEANRDLDQVRGIKFLDYAPGDEEVDQAVASLSAKRQELDVIAKALDDPRAEHTAAQLEKLKARRNNLQQEISLLERIRNKRQ